MLETTTSATITDTQIQQLVLQEIKNGDLTNQSNRLYFVFTPPGTKVTLGTRDCAKNFYDYHNLFSSTDPTDKKQALLAYYVRATDSGSSLIDSITANGWNPDASNRDDGQDHPFQHSPQ